MRSGDAITAARSFAPFNRRNSLETGPAVPYRQRTRLAFDLLATAPLRNEKAENIDDPSRLSDFIAANLPSLSSVEKQELLESLELKVRLERLNRQLAREVEVLQLRSKIQSDVQDQVTQSQREYYLREQMKAIERNWARPTSSRKWRNFARKLTPRE